MDNASFNKSFKKLMHSRSPERASAMKFNLKNISILGFIALFFVSAIACCCLTDTVQAEEPAPSCHQTAHESGSSQSAEDCDCDHSLSTVQKETFLKSSLVQVSTAPLDQLFSDDKSISEKVNVYQVPPLVYDTSPLYIKHSNLRI